MLQPLPGLDANAQTESVLPCSLRLRAARAVRPVASSRALVGSGDDLYSSALARDAEGLRAAWERHRITNFEIRNERDVWQSGEAEFIPTGPKFASTA